MLKRVDDALVQLLREHLRASNVSRLSRNEVERLMAKTPDEIAREREARIRSAKREARRQDMRFVKSADSESMDKLRERVLTGRRTG